MFVLGGGAAGETKHVPSPFPPPPQAVLEAMRTAARDAALFRLREKIGPLLPLEVGLVMTCRIRIWCLNN